MLFGNRGISPCALAGLSVAGAMLVLAIAEPSEKPPLAPTEQVAADPLQGLWTRYEGRAEGDPLRFWYFHGDGKGLYRYGRVGLANTHSFDYSLRGETLELTFRKSGERHRIGVSVERDANGRTWLRMADDPREPGARYQRVESDLDLEDAAAQWRAGALARGGIGDRIWIDYRNFATGGTGFDMYQLGHTQIDGRGVGWFHHGDFDEWTTESLTYRIDGERLELFFDFREEPNVTGWRVVGEGEERVMELDQDPRDYWARHRYRDGGKSFGSVAFGAVVGFEGMID